MSKSGWAVATTLVALSLCAPGANAAGSPRAFVSGHGTDAAGCGAPTAPCRSFQYVNDNIVAAGGEIDVLDGAGYGVLTITKPLSIVNDGAGVASIQASSGKVAIEVASGPNTQVSLRGLTIDGMGAGSSGIYVYDVGTLTIANCSVRGFVGNAIEIAPAENAKILMTDVQATDSATGIEVFPSNGSQVSGLLQRVNASDNSQDGISFPGSNGTASGPIIVMTIANSVASGNGANGFHIAGGNDGGSQFVTLREDLASSNGAAGLLLAQGATVRVTRSTFNQNNVNGVKIGNASLFQSAGDNDIIGNGSTDVVGTISEVSHK